MKKLGSILGISVISVAVAFAPAFAQQALPQGPGAPAALQPKSDVKTPASDQAGKDEKNLPAKPGPDVKASAPVPSPKPAGNVKSEKPASDVKAGSTSSKTDKGAKGQKGTNAKPEANLKSTKTVKTAARDKSSATPKHHAKKSSGKVTSGMHAKTRASNLDTRRKAGKS